MWLRLICSASSDCRANTGSEHFSARLCLRAEARACDRNAKEYLDAGCALEPLPKASCTPGGDRSLPPGASSLFRPRSHRPNLSFVEHILGFVAADRQGIGCECSKRLSLCTWCSTSSVDLLAQSSVSRVTHSAYSSRLEPHNAAAVPRAMALRRCESEPAAC